MSLLQRAAALVGLDLKAVGARNLRLAVHKAMERLGLGEKDFLARLALDPRERRLLAGEAVVQETWLFRDQAAFEVLGRFAAGLERPVRVLCAPCSTGEEPASAAVALARAGLSACDFLVDAVDANPAALELARFGRFGPESVRQDAQDCPHLRRVGSHLVLDPALLGRIRFLEADALDAGFLAGEPGYQAILCRHLLIYLDEPARQRLASNLKRLLAPGGALITAPAEASAFDRLGLSPWTGCRKQAPSARAGGTGQAGPVAMAGLVAPRAPEPAAGLRNASREDHLEQAVALADAGKVAEALELVESDLRRSCPTARHFHIQGAALLALGRDDEAEQALRRALYLEPGHAQALAHLELLARSKGRPGEAALLAGRARRAGEAGT